MKKIVFIAKTDLNLDGRILNQMQILKEYFSNIFINFIILEDKPTIVDLEKNIKIHPIKPLIRNSSLLKSFTVFDFTFKALFKLIKIKPEILHVQDSAVVLPCLIYKICKRRKVKLIYDDHEIPNENENLKLKIFSFFEKKLILMSDVVISANEERGDWLKDKLLLEKSKMKYFLNLPYNLYSGKKKAKDSVLENKIIELDSLKGKHKIIMHQGPLYEERGRMKLADFSLITPRNVKILIIGVSKDLFNTFIKEFHLNEEKFIFLGYINYHHLDKVWSRVDASIVIYLPTYINNRLCAPNRFYISLKYKIPIIVNKENPILNNFITKFNCGFFIEYLKTESCVQDIFNLTYKENILTNLIEQQKKSFVRVYKEML